MAITGRAGLIALLLTVAVLAAPAPGLTVLAVDAALLVVVLIDVVLAASPRALHLRRVLPVAARLGEPAAAALIVDNPTRRTVRARIRDAWPPSAGLRPASAGLTVPAQQRRRIEQQLLPTRRGNRSSVTVTVRCFGPLGLAARQRNVTVEGRIRVQPGFPSRRLLPEKLSQLRFLEGLVAARGPGRGTEFESLRDYVRGDDVRAIDWRASGRRATRAGTGIMVRQYRPERDRRLIIVIDTGRTSAARVGDIPRLDAVLDAGLLLGTVASRAGDRLDLIAADAVPRALVERATPATLSDVMADLEPALVEADAGGMVGQVMRLARRRSLVVLFTDLTAAAIEEGVLPALGPLLRRHVLVVAAVADPLVDELAGGRGSAQAVYAAAAAERALGERRRLASALRRRGVEVVDAPPEAFASAVTDRYLALKAAGRL
jgi:uncharacterized protein (DUF58 family)